MKVGDKIRVPLSLITGWDMGNQDFTVEEFRHTLGIFEDEEHRKAGNFTPLCNLYERGPYSEDKYISNYGTYTTNLVQGWMDLA